MTIKSEGIAEHINNYFADRGSDKTYDDVIRLKNMKIGGKHLSIHQQMIELGVNSRATIYSWHRHINGSL